MLEIRNKIFKRAINKNAKIVLPESEDGRIKEAVQELRLKGFYILDLEEFNFKEKKYIDYLSRLSFTKNWSKEMIISYLKNPLNLGATLVALDDADGMVAGSVNSTADVIRTAIRIVGIENKSKWVSSIFLMVHPDEKFIYTYTDCAVIPEPTSEQLAEIAKNAATFHQLLTNEKPIIAFLSFSTKGSSDHYRAKKIHDSVKIFGNKYPNFSFDGEIQFDAAINYEISNKKIKNSKINGSANVFIFPNIDAGNIAYKITERLAGYSAWGPLLQGLKKPIHDLSRGCSVQDIIDITMVAALQKIN